LSEVLVRDDAAAEHHNVAGPVHGELLEDPSEVSHVSTREHGQTDEIRVLLKRGCDNVGSALAEP
jgi:hypothetical protein